MLGVFAAPGYLALAGTTAHPSELENPHHRIAGFSWRRAGRLHPLALHRGDETVKVQSGYALAVDDGNAYLAAGVAGVGIMWLPLYMGKAHLARGEFVPLFEGWRIDPMPLYIAYPPNRHVSAKLRVFMDCAAELMNEARPARARA
ncbi:transcriptional regulator [Burkholderia latens]|uniref:Transcriptional regulator n=1 Tax=Burkholderia latens TaxID=488446 RepID=A0A6P2QCU2_9BURK|nr:transcriptional regulator [Burkholderia latens]